MNFLDNKKGQGMSTSTIVLLILGVVVLVVLILGFSSGWKKMAPWLSSSNVDDVVSACSAACSTGAKYEFCSAPRELKDSEKNKYEASCAVFSVADEFKKYGIAPCPSIDCGLRCEDITVDDKKGMVVPKGSTGGYNVSAIASNLLPDQACLVQ